MVSKATIKMFFSVSYLWGQFLIKCQFSVANVNMWCFKIILTLNFGNILKNFKDFE